MSNRESTCAERWQGALDQTIEDIREAIREDTLYEYGLSFDWNHDGYFEWCLSWGGPADYLRFYVDRGRYGLVCDRVDYSFQDWFDGETRTVEGDDGEFLRDVFDRYFSEISEPMCEME
jgi:hypothetical protein